MASSQGSQLQLQPIIMMLVLVQVVVVLILSLSSATIAAPPTEADLKNLGCMNRCGNLSIPYPFGVKENCYRNDNFLITCNGSQPYLLNSNISVTNLWLEGELRIMNYISHQCYDRFGRRQRNNDPILRTGKFSISNTKNKFTAIGCDTYGGIAIQDENNVSVVATGCVSECVNMDYVSNGTCSGNGCCQTFIPKGVGKIIIIAKSFYNHTNVSNFNPCSYAFVVEEGAFNFSTTYLQDFKEEKVPMVLDWGIGNVNIYNIMLY